MMMIDDDELFFKPVYSSVGVYACRRDVVQLSSGNELLSYKQPSTSR